MTLRLEPPLRRATPDDCRRLAELIEIAGEGIPSFLWSEMALPGQTPLEVGAARAARPDTSFSYRNAVVAEVAGEVVAMLLAYRLPDQQAPAELDRLPALLRPLIELERLVPGSFYLNALAALPGHRGRGLGSRLLTLAPELARGASCTLLSVQVFAQNQGACHLYVRHGYREHARRPVVPHSCYPYDTEVILMTRSVAPPP